MATDAMAANKFLALTALRVLFPERSSDGDETAQLSAALVVHWAHTSIKANNSKSVQISSRLKHQVAIKSKTDFL